jgi:hypothetical protein
MSRAGLLTLLLAAATAPASAQPPGDRALGDALVRALRPALPFPAARGDDTPETGGPTPVWAVRWPAAGEGHVEVLANPLNGENRARALDAEQQIQDAAMQSQRQSLADYEKALSEFERTGQVSSPLHAISLRDDGVPGEQYDAESQLTVTVERFDPATPLTVATGALPVVVPVDGPAAAVRMPANVYLERGPEGTASSRFCPEQAWVLFGALGTPAVHRIDAARVEVSVPAGGAPGVRGAALVRVSGNPALVSRVLAEADWDAFRTLFGG